MKKDLNFTNQANPTKKPITQQSTYLLQQYLKGKNQPIEIDLHIEELIEFSERIEPWRKIKIQLDHVKQCLEDAIELKIPQLVFIHGVGEGILKNEIRKMLHNYTNIHYQDASYQKYGRGATEITIRGLHA